MKPKRVELHIDKLVVDGVEGVSRTDAACLGAAVERELGRLVAEGGLPFRLQRAHRMQRIDDSDVTRTRQHDLSSLGKRIAKAIYGGNTG